MTLKEKITMAETQVKQAETMVVFERKNVAEWEAKAEQAADHLRRLRAEQTGLEVFKVKEPKK